MEQELISKKIAIVGCGAAGGMVSVLLAKNPCVEVFAFDLKQPFSTLLPTGGGRCNLTYDESDVREFVRNYPRGEKFLLSVFSRFNQQKTRQLFKDLGIKTYVQEDKRVFPVSNSSKKTIEQLQKHLESSNFKFIKEKVLSINKQDDTFVLKTENSTYKFDVVVLATGGKGNGCEIAKSLGHRIIEQKPSLCSLDILEKEFYSLSGLSFKDVEASIKIGKNKVFVNGDLLFAHNFITGPCVFKISALTAYENFDDKAPLEITFKLVKNTQEQMENYLKNNSKKTVKNAFSKFIPERYISIVLTKNKIPLDKQVAQLKKIEKDILINSLLELKLHAIKRVKDSEIVMAGGVDLKEIESKTMESKLIKGLYFAGEMIDIDAFTGGFNLQNCWSSAYIVVQNFN